VREFVNDRHFALAKISERQAEKNSFLASSLRSPERISSRRIFDRTGVAWAGTRAPAGMGQLGEGYLLSVIAQVRAGEDGDNCVAAFLDIFAAAFFSVHQHNDESDLSVGFFDRVDCLNG
jgi:hypothetical protein